jgi:hypothetical protein
MNMDKVKKFLEAHVQWVALALAAAFLGWTVYGYVLQKPASSAVGNVPTASPGDIPHIIWDGPGQQVKGDLEGKEVPKDIGPKVNYPQVAIDARNGNSPAVAIHLPTPWTPIPVDDNINIDKGAGTNQGPKITALPDAPPLVNLLISKGHSNVPAPLPPQIAGAPAPQGNQVQAVDKIWLTVEGTVQTAKLAESFKKVGIAQGSPFSSTCMFRVILIRQERLLDGSWGPDTEIGPLDISQLVPLPPIDAAPMDQKDYQDFAEKSVVPICTPAFYQVLQGDVWYEPGTKNPNQTLDMVDDGFDPKDPLAYKGDPTKLLPSEKKLYDDAKAKQEKTDALRNRRNTPQPNNTPQIPDPGAPGGGGNGNNNGGGGGGGGRRGRGMAADPRGDEPGLLMPPRISAERPPGVEGGPPPGMMAPQQQPGAAPNPLPAGSFDPYAQSEFRVWAHDPTVQAGKTYQYKLRYIISNPVARTVNLCDPQKLAKQFYITSKDSDWTPPVSVESDTNFFAVELKHGVHFDVFKWKDGSWQMESVTTNPGDMVGTVDTNPQTQVKTDFTTGWTLVDIRDDPSDIANKILVLVSDNGTVIRKELAIDAHSTPYRQLYQKAMEGKAAAQAGAPPANPN